MIKKGDNVIVISGREKGKKGQIVKVLSDKRRVVIDGLNLSKRHERARRQNQKGQVIEKAMPIHVSNISLVENGKAVKAGWKFIGEKKVRVSRRTGKEI